VTRNLTSLTTRRELLLTVSAAALTAACSKLPGGKTEAGTSSNKDADVAAAMKRATRFMRERCAVNGGYVWAYSADFSRSWGEMEAYPSMIWIQPPGTATIGHLYLDCYHVTGDEYYYEAAAEVASALIAAQHPSGGWNYLHDFAGEDSAQRWYDTIGKNGWRLEEFHHYYGNATFDDAGTSEASQFLLRMYLEKRDEQYAAPLELAIRFVLDSQYDNGGWPQRYPPVEDAPALHGRADYTSYVTFNDDVAGENIKFLLMVWQSLGDRRALSAIERAMMIFPATLQPAPQAGWGLQHTLEDLKPIGARTYEPDALVTSATGGNISLMLDFYEWTADTQFIDRIPEALHWLESVQLAKDAIRMPGREFPTFIEFETNRALINHRSGSNVVNGAYYQDYNSDGAIVHYSQWRAIDLDGLHTRYEQIREVPAEELKARSPLNKQSDFELPRFFSTQQIEVSDLNSNAGEGEVDRPSAERVADLLSTLNAEGYWPTPLTAVSNPYIGDGPETAAPGNFTATRVGDASDTSPHFTDKPAIGISTGTFIQNMSALMQVLDLPAADQ